MKPILHLLLGVLTVGLLASCDDFDDNHHHAHHRHDEDGSYARVPPPPPPGYRDDSYDAPRRADRDEDSYDEAGEGRARPPRIRRDDDDDY